jgi:hypothetical protein
MMKLKFAALLAASALTFGTGAAMAAPQQDHAPPKAEQGRGPHHDMIDLNKDGSISKDEWMKAAAMRFEKFDVSKDGKLSREEMRFGRFEEMRMHGGRGHGGERGWQHGPHGGPQGGPGRQGPGGPNGPGHRMGPPPADAPTPPAPAN